MKNIEKRIEKLNKKIVRTNELLDKNGTGKNSKKYMITSIGVGLIALIGVKEGFSCVGGYTDTSFSWGNEVIKNLCYLGIGAAIGGSVSYHTKDAREIRITKYLDELHGYALEENKNYPKRVLSKNK